MKKTVLTSLVLVTVGILFGAILVSNFSGGVDLSFARSGGEVKLGGPTPVTVSCTCTMRRWKSAASTLIRSSPG